MTWDTTSPSGSEEVRFGALRIRELKEALETALSYAGKFPVSPSSPEFRPGPELGGDPPTAADGGFFWGTSKTLQWSDGTTWRSIGEPYNTRTLFYQATAPLGWAIVPLANISYPRITTGTWSGAGGGTLQPDTAFTHAHSPPTFYGYREEGTGTEISCKVYMFLNNGSDYFLLQSVATAPGSDRMQYLPAYTGSSNHPGNSSGMLSTTTPTVPLHLKCIVCRKT